MWWIILIGVGALAGGFLLGRKTSEDKFRECVDYLTQKGISTDTAIKVCMAAGESDIQKLIKYTSLIGAGYIGARLLLKGRKKNASGGK